MSNYLKVYSLVSLWCWILFLGYFLYDPGFNSKTLLFLTLAQGLALFEVLHVGMKWVKGSIKPVAIRVFIRVFIVVILHLMGSSSQVQLPVDGRIIIAVIWGFTEIIRHWHALSDLAGKKREGLTWLRYSGYILFYPIGLIGELLISYKFLAERNFTMDVYGTIMFILIIAFVAGYPPLFIYNGKQRRRKLRPKV
ncbi:MAG: very-long-chain (3R)-3-hydroxyacyl-CoA dehydratase [Bacteroidia bacterium]|jgi:very-long-chain (3R)-3-hydroxyacyl-CoA dehydratase